MLRRVSLLLALEGTLLVALGTGYGVVALRADGEHDAAGIAAGSALVVGVLLLVLARFVARGRRWARSPAVVLNVLPLPVALDAFQGGAWWVGLPTLLLAGSVLYLFGTPELRERFRETG